MLALSEAPCRVGQTRLGEGGVKQSERGWSATSDYSFLPDCSISPFACPFRPTMPMRTFSQDYTFCIVFNRSLLRRNASCVRLGDVALKKETSPSAIFPCRPTRLRSTGTLGEEEKGKETMDKRQKNERERDEDSMKNPSPKSQN